MSSAVCKDAAAKTSVVARLGRRAGRPEAERAHGARQINAPMSKESVINRQ
jgi:hypothetical protein